MPGLALLLVVMVAVAIALGAPSGALAPLAAATLLGCAVALRLSLAPAFCGALGGLGVVLSRTVGSLVEAYGLAFAIIGGRGLAPGLARRLVQIDDDARYADLVAAAGARPGLHVASVDGRGVLLHGLTDPALDQPNLAALERDIMAAPR